MVAVPAAEHVAAVVLMAGVAGVAFGTTSVVVPLPARLDTLQYPVNRILESWPELRPPAPTTIFPEVVEPAEPAVPAQPVTESIAPLVHATPELFPNVSVWLPVPSSMVEFAVTLNVPRVSLTPVEAPVLKVPPLSTRLDELLIRSTELIRRTPALMVVVPV